MQLFQLPTELLCHIITSYLHLDRATLRNLCLTCQTLRSISQPILFRTFSELRLRDNYYFNVADGESISEQLVQFGRAITRPDLASCVNSLEINLVFFNAVSQANKLGWYPPAQDIRVLVQSIEQMQSVLESQWIYGIWYLRHYSIIALLIAKTPNLETLILDAAGQIRVDLAWTLALVESLNKPQSGLQERPLVHLKELNLRSSRGINLIDIAPLLLLPSMKTLSAEGLICRKSHSWNGSENPVPLPPASSGISTLILRQSDSEAECLNVLMAACKRLKVIEYSPWILGAEYPYDGRDHFTLEDLFDAVQLHGKYLEELRCDFPWGENWVRPSKPIVNLRHLRSVTMSDPSAEFVTYLRDALEDIHVTECLMFTLKDLKRLLDAKRAHLHSLNRVRVSLSEGGSINHTLGLPHTCSNRTTLLASVAHWRTEFEACGVELLFDLNECDLYTYGDLDINAVHHDEETS